VLGRWGSTGEPFMVSPWELKKPTNGGKESTKPMSFWASGWVLKWKVCRFHHHFTLN
jgi:hypothetical protein